MRKGNTQFCIAICLGLLLTLASFFIHIHPSFNSMINFKTSSYNVENRSFSNDYIQVVIEYHKSHPVFARRPVSTFFIETIKKYTPLGIAQSFSFFNFLFIFFTGFLVFYLALLLKLNFSEALISLIVYHSSFTILFPFFRTIYTYDEPLQYFAVLLSLVAILKNKKIFLMFSLFLILLARESSIIIFPSLFLLYHLVKSKKIIFDFNLIKSLIWFVIPILIYLVFYLIHINNFDNNIVEGYDELTVRISQLSYNFQNREYTIESIAVLVMVIGFSITTLLYYKKLRGTDKPKNMMIPFWLLLILNTLMVYIAARVNESRVLTLPLLFLWPFIGRLVALIISLIKKNKKVALVAFTFTLVVAIINYKIAFKLYKPTGSETFENWFNEYFFLTLCVMSFLISFRVMKYLHLKIKN